MGLSIKTIKSDLDSGPGFVTDLTAWRVVLPLCEDKGLAGASSQVVMKIRADELNVRSSASEQPPCSCAGVFMSSRTCCVFSNLISCSNHEAQMRRPGTLSLVTYSSPG